MLAVSSYDGSGALIGGALGAALLAFVAAKGLASTRAQAEALIFNRDGPQVALVEDGVVRIRKVSVARDLGTSLELRDGVKKGDRVVLNPGVNLLDGNRVHTAGG